MLPVPARLTGASWAVFLDVDGTLLDIADAPDRVHVHPRVLELLGALRATTSGAVALVSGRSIADLDGLFEPLELTAAGLHGAERRDASGRLHLHAADPRLDDVRATLLLWSEAHPGTLLEDKGGALALHFRRAPEAEHAARAVVGQVLEGLGRDFVLQRGKCVLEIKPSGVSKATAIREFMEEPPFIGRRPVFVGDDVTDEDGFEYVRRQDGMAVTVGERPSEHADWRLPDVAAVLEWLEAYAYEREEA
jgi:trehalose 6-phosphate phosphatase